MIPAYLSAMRCVVSIVPLVLLTSACSDEDRRAVTAMRQAALVPAPATLLAQCRETADAVGYPAPCPTRLPPGLGPTQGSGGCRFQIVGQGGTGGCSNAWRGWVVGSSETSNQHLVITTSPRALSDPARVVNGPGWYPGARVRPLALVTVNGQKMRAVYVPPKTNDGSAFAHHVVLIWTVGNHTYAVGFHNVEGIRATLALDVALARAIRLVAPREAP